MEQLALPFAIVTCLWPDTSAPKAVRGQKRLSTLAEALPLAREIGAGSRAPREHVHVHGGTQEGPSAEL